MSLPMTAFLDGNEIPSSDLSADLTVGGLIDRLKDGLSESGSMIFAVACEREEVPPDRLNETLEKPVSSISRLDLISGRPERIALEALEQTRDSFADTFAGIKQSAEALASGNLEKGMHSLVDCVEAWADVHEAVTQGGALVHLDFEKTVIEDRHILDCLNDLNTKLREIKEAVESRDHVLLGDILRYEMDGTLRNWEMMLDSVIGQVKAIAEQSANASFSSASSSTL
ncbi:MAG: hypothetical protein ACE5EC_09065 [Phycisphaerae bacterium]